jgi:MoxR-like ATPase
MTAAIENTIAALLASGTPQTDAQTLYAVGRQNGMTCKQVKETFITDQLRVARGQYDIRLLGINVEPSAVAEPELDENGVSIVPTATAPVPIPAAIRPAMIMNAQKTFGDVEEVYVPKSDSTFVPWGEYKMIKRVIDSKLFFPVYISGLSGNGKTMMVEQACAKAKREFVRVQISPETDETDLIGGFRLVDGETVFYKGPVVKAMERGAVLLIDELDRGSNKIMCLQGVLEGKPVLIKKIGQVIVPAPGFNVIATANTKGRGSEDGRFSAANIIDEAFIERFVATIDQPYPNGVVEKSIILKHMEQFGVRDLEFADKLVAWSQIIRKTFENDGVEEVVSTRRLCHIVKAHSIFNDRAKSIAMCIARFDEDTRSAFSDLYSKIDTQVNSDPIPSSSDDIIQDEEDVPS